MKKIFGVILSLSIMIFSGLMLTACDKDLILVSGVDFYQEEIYASINEVINLSHKVYPSNASNKSVTYWSSNDNVASVDAEGNVTVKDNGEAIVAVRTSDGGFEDYCKIITNIDPTSIIWDTDDGRIVATDASLGYTGKATVAVDQNIRLDVKYLINGIEDDGVTNRNIKFSSSNPDNIEIINEKEGIFRAVDSNVRNEEGVPSSDITATLQTAKGELKIVCRVEINEYSKIDNLYIKRTAGNSDVLIKRDGSDSIILDAEDKVGQELHAYLYNDSNIIKSDYAMTVSSSDPSIFTVNAVENSADKVYYFTVKSVAEGTATLNVATTCFDESGKQIIARVNVVVQSAVEFVEVSASDRKESSYIEKKVFKLDENNEKILVCENVDLDHEHIEDLTAPKICYETETIKEEKSVEIVSLNGTTSSFTLNLTFKDKHGNKIENAQRQIYFVDDENPIPAGNYTDNSGITYYSPADYVSYYGNNNFKIVKAPDDSDINKLFYIRGYVYRENNVEDLDAEEGKIYFTYAFFIRNELEGMFVSPVPAVNGVKPSSGITELNVMQGFEKSLYVYSYSTSSFSESQPVNVLFDTTNCEDIVEIQQVGNEFIIKANKGTLGEGLLVFTATDGKTEVKVQLIIHVVADVVNP